VLIRNIVMCIIWWR